MLHTHALSCLQARKEWASPTSFAMDPGHAAELHLAENLRQVAPCLLPEGYAGAADSTMGGKVLLLHLQPACDACCACIEPGANIYTSAPAEQRLPPALQKQLTGSASGNGIGSASNTSSGNGGGSNDGDSSRHAAASGTKRRRSCSGATAAAAMEFPEAFVLCSVCYDSRRPPAHMTTVKNTAAVKNAQWQEDLQPCAFPLVDNPAWQSSTDKLSPMVRKGGACMHSEHDASVIGLSPSVHTTMSIRGAGTTPMKQ